MFLQSEYLNTVHCFISFFNPTTAFKKRLDLKGGEITVFDFY